MKQRVLKESLRETFFGSRGAPVEGFGCLSFGQRLRVQTPVHLLRFGFDKRDALHQSTSARERHRSLRAETCQD